MLITENNRNRVSYEEELTKSTGFQHKKR